MDNMFCQDTAFPYWEQ